MKKHMDAREKGQALAEFALVLLVLLALIMVIIDLSRAVFYYSVLHNAAREGARFAITNPTATDTEIISAAQELTAGMNFDSAVVTRPTTKTIKITLAYTFRPATPVLSLIRGDPSFGAFTLQAQSTMNIER